MTNPWDAMAGNGNWMHFPIDRLDEVVQAARSWHAQLRGIDKPWLCWCVDDAWCVVQQRLVLSAGWTPIVGTDGPADAEVTVVDGALRLDFNAELNIPRMWMHFPLEFVYLYCDKLAFWHSDVLPPVAVVKQLADQFQAIAPGETIAVRHRPTLLERVRRLQKGVRSKDYAYWLKHNGAVRWFEVVGCTTREASKSQFEQGFGWWRHAHKHPHAADGTKRLFWDHGAGIRYWETKCGGNCSNVRVDVEPFHYATKGKWRVNDKQGRAMKGKELSNRYDLDQIVATLGL